MLRLPSFPIPFSALLFMTTLIGSQISAKLVEVSMVPVGGKATFS
jgi:hypothetical protein